MPKKLIADVLAGLKTKSFARTVVFFHVETAADTNDVMLTVADDKTYESHCELLTFKAEETVNVCVTLEPK